MHTVIANTVETVPDSGIGVTIATLPTHEAAVDFALLLSQRCGGGEVVVVQP